MTINRIHKRLLTGVLSFALAAPVAGMAQWPWGRGRNNRTGNSQVDNAYNAGLNRGYQEGVNQGQWDLQNNRRGRHDKPAHDTDGYDNSMGPKGQYKQGYREGYARGYNDGLNGTNASGYPNQYPNNYPYPNGGNHPNQYPNSGQYGYGVDQVAQQNGYQDGVYYGERDRANGNNSNPRDAKGYRDADHGYTDSLGSKSEFQQAYRQAFLQGYQEGYNRSNGGYGYPNNYPNNGNYPNGGYGYPNSGVYGNNAGQIAQQNGYTDGVYYGQRDRADGNSSNATGAKGYRDADHGYSDSLGNKDQYQQMYRDAFIAGYNAGYNGRRR